MRGCTLSAVLLAGGLSTRMGRDKATIPFDSEPLGQRQIHVLKALHPVVLSVSVRAPAPWIPADIETILDPPRSLGPLGGIATALLQLKTTHLLVMAVDMPRMTAAHLAKLWSMASEGAGVVPRYDGSLEPLCAIYPVESVQLAEELLHGDDVSVKNFAQKLSDRSRVRIYELLPDESPLYFNMNTMNDFYENQGGGTSLKNW